MKSFSHTVWFLQFTSWNNDRHLEAFGLKQRWQLQQGGARLVRLLQFTHSPFVCLFVCFFCLLDVGASCACRWVFAAPRYRQITTEEGEQRAKETNVVFIETSAKTGYTVKQVERVHVPAHVHNSCPDLIGFLSHKLRRALHASFQGGAQNSSSSSDPAVVLSFNVKFSWLGLSLSAGRRSTSHPGRSSHLQSAWSKCGSTRWRLFWVLHVLDHLSFISRGSVSPGS